LRNDGHLVYVDALRRSMWCFYLARKDTSAMNQSEQLGLTAVMEVCGYRLGLVEEGGFEPVSLQKSRPPGVNTINTPSSSSSSGSALDMPARSNQAFSTLSATGSGNNAMFMDSKIALAAIPDTKGYGSIPIKEIHEFFISAMLSSLTTSLCCRIGAIPLNHRTVLLPPQAFQTDETNLNQPLRKSALATFRVYLTTTGSLVISIWVSLLNGLISSADALRSSLLPAGPLVIAAPLGAFGAMQGIVDADSHVADPTFIQSPDTQTSGLRHEPGDRFSQWRNTCSRLLQIRGMSPSLLDGCAWLNIHFLQRKLYDQRTDGKRTPLLNSGPTAPWPSVLCFRRPRVESVYDRYLERSLSVGMDPLNEAKVWCKNSSDREDVLNRRGKERLAGAAESRDGLDSDIKNIHAGGFSPVTLRRQSNGATAAAGIMYPTPPDGIHLSAVTPSFEGTVLSPANPPATAVMADLDSTLQPPAAGGDGYDEGWGAEPKRDQPSGSFLEGEGLYGDIGENMFEGNEIIEDDFNFFDETPGGDFDLPGLVDMGSAMDLSTDTGQVVVPSPTPAKSTIVNGNVRPAQPEFTKPELKHARSTLAEETRQQNNTANFNANKAIGIKRQPSPFNPDTVYKRIRASLQVFPPTKDPHNNVRGRKGSVFERVNFDPSLTLSDKKYQESGRFNYTLPTTQDQEKNRHEITALSVPGQARRLKTLKALPSNIGTLISRMSGGLGGTPTGRDDVPSDSEDSAYTSDEENGSEAAGVPSSPAKSSFVRRRLDDDVISMAASFKDLENISADSPGYGQVDLVRLSAPEVPELPLTKYFADPEPSAFRPLNSDHDYMTIAQIITEQAASGSLRLGVPRCCSELQDVRKCLLNAVRYSIQGLRAALPRSLSGAAECQLRPLVEVQDVPLLGQPNRIHPRPSGQDLVKPLIYQISSPHLELRRHETQLSVLPSAMTFWESLGLGPVQGPKDVISVCVFPYQEGLRDNAASFIERIRSTYESYKLGTFELLPSTNGIADGLLPFFPDQDTASPGLAISRAGSVFGENVMNLVQALAASQAVEKNFVIFYVYSPESPGSIVDSCVVFWEIFEHYKRAMTDRKKSILNDLVLQLIPLDLVATETSVSVLTPQDSIKLCLETYDRCTLFGGAMPAPAIVLEQPLPKTVDFKVTTTPSPNLLHENGFIHIAYAQSVDDRWLSVAWTNNRGSKQMSASYCLRRRGKQLSRRFEEIAYEIWDTTNDLISMYKVHWRVTIAKCGPMDQQEADVWINLAQSENCKASVTLTLLTVDTNPSLQLIPPPIRIPLATPAVFYTTPVSTPQASSTMSPDQSGNPSTPMAGGSTVNPTTPGGGDGGAIVPEQQVDADATLVDVLDATWGVVVSHRLNNSTSLTELNPALASGYLIKRCGTRPEDAPVLMEVNIVHTEGSPRVYETLLREILVYFRGLGTLARVRGVVEKDTDVRPWHVAAAEKATRALYQLM